MKFRGGEFSTGTKGNFQSELTEYLTNHSPMVISLELRGRFGCDGLRLRKVTAIPPHNERGRNRRSSTTGDRAGTS